MLWDDESVTIVDFGHAQMVEGAQSYIGTRGFTAPEVAVNKKPHSTAADAFSVGKTLEYVAEQANAQNDKTLAEIIAGLTKNKVEERWTLSAALKKLPHPPSPARKRQRRQYTNEVTPQVPISV